MKHKHRQGLQILVAVMAFSALASAGAQELPPRKPGLWKESHYENKDSQNPDVIYHCADHASDEKLRLMAKNMAACEEGPSQRKGNTIVGSSVCQMMGSKVTTRYVVSGDMNTEYRIESTSTYEPPMFGLKENDSVIVSQWQGPCQPGQKPGDMVISEDGQTEVVNAEDLGQMQQLTKLVEQMQSSQGMGQMLEMLQQGQSAGGAGAVDLQELSKMMEQLQQLQQMQNQLKQ